MDDGLVDGGGVDGGGAGRPDGIVGDDRQDDDEMVELASRLFGLARRGDTATLTAYLDAGVPANLTNHSGDTLVMLAAYHGHAETVRALLAHGADPNQANDRDQTPLAGAVFRDEPEVIRSLVEAGADPDAGHPTAVETAVLFGRQDLADLLRPT